MKSFKKYKASNFGSFYPNRNAKYFEKSLIEEWKKKQQKNEINLYDD